MIRLFLVLLLLSSTGWTQNVNPNAFQVAMEQRAHVDTPAPPVTEQPTYRAVQQSGTTTQCVTCNATISPAPTSSGEGKCSCTHNKIWLDIVILLDRSKAMSYEVVAAAGFLGSLFKVINFNTTIPQSSRVALLTYSNDVTVVGGFDKYGSSRELTRDMLAVKPSDKDETVDLARALQEVQIMFDRKNDRPNVQRVVMVVAAEYKFGGSGDPKRVAAQLKGSGISILTVAHRSDIGGQLAQALRVIASPNMNFVSKEKNIDRNIRDALCYVNCFCKPNWHTYKAPFKSDKAYGECLYSVPSPADRALAQEVCLTMADKSHLVYIKTQTKHDKLLSILRDQGQTFHIGWKRDGAGQPWRWEGESAQPELALPQQFWKETTGGNCGVGVESNGTLSYENRDCEEGEYSYVCQAPVCDTDNYCSFNDFYLLF